MLRKNYRFSPDRIDFTPVDRNFGWWFRRIGIFVLSCMILGTIGFFTTSRIVETPAEKNLKAYNEDLLSLYESLDNRLNDYDQILDGIRVLDDSIYRSLIGSDPLHKSLREAGTGGYDRSASLRSAVYPESIIKTATRVNNLQAKLQIQHNSYREVFREALNNQERLKHLPAIMPIYNKDLRGTGSGFGMRMHPILNIMQMHEGMDFYASIGTDVYASADGTVRDARLSTTFGNVIEVDHGYGILSLYAHLSKIEVRKGQKVYRGQIIGKVGDTGQSSGPHLHYEVHVNRKEVDPVNYYFQDLSPQEYQAVVAIAKSFTTSMD